MFTVSGDSEKLLFLVATLVRRASLRSASRLVIPTQVGTAHLDENRAFPRRPVGYGGHVLCITTQFLETAWSKLTPPLVGVNHDSKVFV